MFSIAQKIGAAKDVVIVGAVIGVGALGVFVFFKGFEGIKKFIEDPVGSMDYVSSGIVQGKVVKGAKKGLKNATGGMLNTNFKTIGTLDTAQDDYNSEYFINQNKGLSTLITGGVIFLSTFPLIGQWVLGTAAVSRGIEGKIRTGRDFAATNIALKEEQRDRDNYLAAQQNEIDQAKKSKVKYKPSFIANPHKYLTEQQKVMIGSFIAKAMKQKRAAPFPENKIHHIKSALEIYHVMKQLQLIGFFITEDEAKAVNMKELTFINCVQTLVQPHGTLIVVPKKKVDAVQKFLKIRKINGF